MAFYNRSPPVPGILGIRTLKETSRTLITPLHSVYLANYLLPPFFLRPHVRIKLKKLGGPLSTRARLHMSTRPLTWSQFWNRDNIFVSTLVQSLLLYNYKNAVSVHSWYWGGVAKIHLIKLERAQSSVPMTPQWVS